MDVTLILKSCSEPFRSVISFANNLAPEHYLSAEKGNKYDLITRKRLSYLATLIPTN